MAPLAQNIDIYDKYVTPLAGTFLNLPKEPCVLQCPSCGIQDRTKVEMEMHRNPWCYIFLSRFCHGCCCCCIGEDCSRVPIRSEKPNHYCNHCGCYFGQSDRKTKIRVPTN